MERVTDEAMNVLYGCLLCCLCFLFSCGAACAEDKAPIVPRHNFEVGLGLAYYDYEEDTYDIEIDGLMYGIVGSYAYHNRIMVGGSLEFSMGDLEYDGSYVVGGPSVERDTEDWIVECRGLIGYDYVFKGEYLVTPYIGLGYRHWNNDFDDPWFIDREIQYWYSPVGLKTVGPLLDNWSWGTSLEYDIFWDGEVENHALYIPDLDQDSGYGLKFSLQFTRPIGESHNLSIEPYMSYWHIEKSEEKTRELSELLGGADFAFRAHEPSNDTLSYGLRVVLEF